MKPPKHFGACLQDLMRLHRLSVADLSPLVGGKTDLQRALDEELSEQKRQALYDKLAALSVFSDDELFQLRHSLYVSKLGVQEALMQLVLYRFLNEKSFSDRLQPSQDDELGQRLAVLSTADSIRIICLNSCYPTLFSAFATLFSDPARDIELRHFVQSEGDSVGTSRLLFAAFPILFDQRYFPCSLSEDSDIQGFMNDFVFVQYWKNGKKNDLCFVMKVDGSPYWLQSSTRNSMADALSELLAHVFPAPIALKRMTMPISGYVDMMIRYLGYELNRVTYSLCTDIGFVQIPPEIVDSAIDRERLQQLSLADPELVQQLKLLLERRHLNFYTKKKPDYHITTYEGMKRFLATGHSNSHFAGFRDFTPKERVQIVDKMLTTAENNSLYHLHVLKEEYGLVNYSILGFDKIGVNIIPAGMAYHDGAMFNYLTLDGKEFTRVYSLDYTTHIATDFCYDIATSVRMLRGLLTEYQQTLRA